MLSSLACCAISSATRWSIDLPRSSGRKHLRQAFLVVSLGSGARIARPVPFIAHSVRSLQESRTTRTIARTFVPEFNHSIDFPVPLVWNDNRNHTISLAEMLEHGELKIDMYHQISSAEESNQHGDKRSLDVHLGYCTIPLRELIARHTGEAFGGEAARIEFSFIPGIKGWYSLASANRAVTSDASSDPSEHCVGGVELFIRFGQQDDRRRIIDSAKALGWVDDHYTDAENFLDGKLSLTLLNSKFPLFV